MPREIDNEYRRVNFICFDCRKAKKDFFSSEASPTCPDCSKPMVHPGQGLRVPRRNQKNQWENIYRLWRAGYRFPMTSMSPVPSYPDRLSEVDQFIQDNPDHPYRYG